MRTPVEPAANTSPAVRRKIVVFEQDEFLVSLLHLLLHREGFELSVITSAEQAMAYLRTSNTPEILFMNQNWILDDQPSMLEQIQLHAGWQDVPVIMLLNYYNEEIIERALVMGASDYLLQPFEPGELLDIIQKYSPFIS